MKYRITYDFDSGKGCVTINVPESEMRETVDKLRNLGCYNIMTEELIPVDPCNNCKRQLCYGCEHSN